MTDTILSPGDLHPVSGAMLIRRVAFWTPLDNHQPVHRDQADGTLEEWLRTDGTTAYVLTGMNRARDADRAVYLLDDGRTVTPWYIAGWTPTGDIILNAFPVNVHPDGTPRLRADDGRPVDYANWSLGPRRAYHLKITREI